MNSIDRRIARLKAQLPPSEFPIWENAERPPQIVEIYFIECGDWIKIGRSTNADKRLTDLYNANPYPVTFLGSFMGQAEKECELHERFKGLRHKGEWFRKDPELLRLINELCDLPAQANETGTRTWESHSN